MQLWLGRAIQSPRLSKEAYKGVLVLVLVLVPVVIEQ